MKVRVVHHFRQYEGLYIFNVLGFHVGLGQRVIGITLLNVNVELEFD